MQNIDGVVAHPVENPEWIAHGRRNPDVGALRDTRSSVRGLANAVDNLAQPPLDRLTIAGLAWAV
jgi:hypothetical protein